MYNLTKDQQSISELNTTEAAIDPEFSQYLKNNDLPNSEILLKAANIKQRSVKILVDFDMDVQALELVLGSMRKQRTTMKQLVGVYDSVLAPIRHIPDDILEEILYHCLPTTRNARPFISESPLLLTVVCKKWRAIAMSAPRLWASLHIPIIFDYRPTSEGYNTLLHYHPLKPAMLPKIIISELQTARNVALNQWLQRSGSLPISLSLYCSSSSPYSFIFDTHPYHEYDRLRYETFALVGRYADRLRYLDAVVSEDNLEQLSLELGRHIAPGNLRLRSLRISTGETTFYPHNMSVSNLPSISILFPQTSLRNLSVSGNLGLHLAINILPSHLTTLTSHTQLDIGHIGNILGACQQLQQCHFNIYNTRARFPADSPSPPLAPVAVPPNTYLPALKNFSLHGSLPDIQTLCGVLESPSLLNLQLYIDAPTPVEFNIVDDHDEYSLHDEVDLPYPPPSTKLLCHFLSQCKSLESLIIDPSFVLAAELQAIFSAIPQIKALTLDNCLSGRPGSYAIANINGPGRSPTLSELKYHVHPLLNQERVSRTTGQREPLQEPLLPHLESFSWNQFSHLLIPDELLVQFIKDRLYVRSRTNTQKAPQRLTASLRDIKICLLVQPDSIDFDAEIVRHTELLGLKRGIDFNLEVSFFPWVELYTKTLPQYVIDRNATIPQRAYYLEDNLLVGGDVTWPRIDI
ncbi:hypothetical protein BJ165DRAFT_1612604 [Panaeolus papilionaceus]|nr:hypothetical protein BJ165DRAFT_1612604 [Panaeolus papilionaceus]